MESGNKQKTHPRSHHVVISTLNEGEISMLDVLLSLKRQWKMIFIVTFAVTLAVLIFTSMMPKVYRAEVILLPPQASDVALFSIPDLYATSEENLFFYTTTTEDLYVSMLRNLRSNALRKQFFGKHKLYDFLKKDDASVPAHRVFQQKFNDLLLVKDGGARNKGSLEYVTVTLDGFRQDLISQWLNDFVDFVDRYTVREVINTIKTNISVKQTIIGNKISSLRITAKQRREDEIVKLTEALAVEEKMGGDDQHMNPSERDPQQENGGSDAGESVLPPDYRKDAKALQLEVMTLKKRKNDDPYIPELRGLYEQLTFLKKINIDDIHVRAARIDQPAMDRNNLIKPRLKLMTALGFVLGVIVAVLAAVVRELLIKKRDYQY